MQGPTLQTQGDPSMRPRPRSSLGVRCAACMLASFLLGCGETSRLLQPDDENSRRNELSAEGQAFVLAMSAMNGVVEFQKVLDATVPAPILWIALRDNVWTYGLAGGDCAPWVSDETDSDHDGIPDDLVATFTAQNCTLRFGQQTASVTGSLRVQDLQGMWALRLTYDDVRITMSVADRTTTITMDGVAEVHLNEEEARTLNRVTTGVIESSPAGTSTIRLANDFTTRFTPSGGRTMSPIVARPPGRFAMSGTMELSVSATGSAPLPSGLGRGSYTVELSTPDALVYTGICTPVELFFSGGTIQMLVRGAAGADIVADWPACSSGGPRIRQ